MSTELDAAKLEEIDRIVESIRSKRYGSLEVIDIRPRVQEDSDGVLALFLDITLPAPEEPTWPFDDVMDLRRTIRNLVVHSRLGLPYYMVLHPEGGEEQEEDQGEEPPTARD